MRAMRIIAAADMLLDQRRFQEALLALKALPEKHTAALRLELKAQQQAKNWEQTLPLIDQLERRGVFDATQAGQLRRYAHAENLKRKALDRRALEECWQKIPAQQKRDAKVAAAAAQCFMALGGCAQANQIIEQALEVEWDSELVGLYAECVGTEAIRQIERAETVAQEQPARRGAVARARQAVRAAGTVGQGAELSRSEHLGRADVFRPSGAGATARKAWQPGRRAPALSREP